MSKKYEIELDVDPEYFPTFLELVIEQVDIEFKKGVTISNFINDGPGGGNHCICFECSSNDEMKLIYSVYEGVGDISSIDMDDFKIHVVK